MSDIVSVIVPVYKVENYIRKCVDSILCQTYTNLEVMLVDDESPDRCGDICDEYAKTDNRVRVIHKKNGGLSSARNAALDELRGNWVLCVDGDDYIHPKMVEKLLDAALRYDADISICCHYEDDNNKLLITNKIYDEARVWDRHDALKKLVDDDDIKSYAWGKLYRAELFNGVRYPEGRNYEDIATTYYLFDKAKRVVKIPDFLYFYLIRSDSISYNATTQSWHKGCHASCIGQEERARYFKEKGYKDLYELSLSKLLPYVFSDIRSGYCAGAKENVKYAKYMLKDYKTEFLNNPLISDKDKKIIDVYLKDEFFFNGYIQGKEVVKFASKKLKRAKQKILPQKKIRDFSLTGEKKIRIVYFELPCFDNLGDHAIAYVTEKKLADFCNENEDYELFVVDGWNTEEDCKSLKKYISKKDIIICQGGGNFGNLYSFAEDFRRIVLRSFFNNRIIIMPQTIHYTDDEDGQKVLALDKKIISKCKNITIFARDYKSKAIMEKCFNCNIEFLHDIVSEFDVSPINKERDGILICLRSDKEGTLSLEDKQEVMRLCEENNEIFVTDTCIKRDLTSSKREEVLNKKLEVWGSKEFVVTDRLHGMIFSLITGTPCIVFGNNHHKVYETFKTFEDCGYIEYVDSVESFRQAFIKMQSVKKNTYTRADYSGDFAILKAKILNNGEF